MFNFSFGEIFVITLVGLIVIGPERLPETARFLGHLIGRVRRQVNSVRADIHREMQLEDMKNIHREFSDAARGADKVFQSAARGVSEEARKIESGVLGGQDSSPERKTDSESDDKTTEKQ